MSPHQRLARLLRSRATDADQTGSTLITVMMMGVTLAMVSAVLITNTVFNVERSSKSVAVGGALQAAEAGIHDYLAKLSDDRTYWAHWVHEAETTRTDGTTGANRSWTDTGAPGWGYVSPRDAWKTVGSDFEYNLQIYPPAGSVTTLRIVSTGRQVDAETGLKAMEAIVTPATLSSYVMVVDGDLSLSSSTLTTTGAVYLTHASSGTNDLCHNGVANSNLYAEDRFVTGCGTHTGAGVAYDGDGATGYADIRTQIASPITFGSLLTPLDEITIAAGAAGGIYRTNTAGCAQSSNWYEVTFNADATITIVKHWTMPFLIIFCSSASSSTETVAMPSTGGIYLDKDVTVNASVVDGHVSLRSAGAITIAGNITYEAPGDDVLGLVAEGSFTLSGSRTVNASLFSRTGSFNAGSSDNITFNGMLILKSGNGTIFDQQGNFTWDSNLATVQPPYFPAIGEKKYSLSTIREVNPSL